jgi:RNA polymerase sigma factor, sigma-70 family
MLAALSEDDRDFVSVIFEEYGKQMYSIALDILKNEHDADDALQETMYKIIKYVDKFADDDKSKIRNKIMIGLRASIRNTSFRHYRKKQNKNKYETDEEKVEIDIEDESAIVDDMVIKGEDCRKIKDALLVLSSDLQDTVNLVYYCDFSCVEAAKFLGVTDNAVRNRLYQARKKLKEVLRGDFDEYNKK